MTATTITYSNLYSQPSINIFSIVDTRSNIADPRDTTGVRKFVYDQDPLEKSVDFAGEPYIVVTDATLGMPTNKSINAKKERLTWTQPITIRTIKNGSSGSRTDAGITDMRTIVDSIIKTFKNATIKATLRTYGMWDVDISIVAFNDILKDQDVMYEAQLELEYRTRIAVSS